MKSNKTNNAIQSLNPFLGFGWSTGTRYPKRVEILKNRENKKNS